MQSVHHVFYSREILLLEIYYNKIKSENIKTKYPSMQSIHHVFSSREILLTEIYYNKIRSENIMILHLQHIKCVNLLACVPACACAIAHVSGNNSVDWCTRQEPLMKIFTISGKPSTPPSTCPQSFIIFSIPYKYHH